MASRLRNIARLLLLAGALLVTASPAPAPAGDELMAAAQEVRLRKLHLVRPDLIPFPMAYEVYC